ncbi:MAG TPA: hypothetical protein VES38_06710 [Methylotenera sp.]|nr:hypothetical protein [Methylotenera sp.]
MRFLNAISVLQIALGNVINNAPIHEAEGNLDQAALARENAEDYQAAIDFLTDNVEPKTGNTSTFPVIENEPVIGDLAAIEALKA